MKTIRQMLDRAVVAAAWAAGLMTLAMMLAIVADVAGRTLFGRPIAGTTEIVSAYCMTALAFLPLALVTRERGHIAVEAFTGWMRPRSRALLDMVAAAVTLAYTGALAWAAVDMAIGKTGIGEARQAGTGLVEIWPARWLAAGGFVLMALCIVAGLSRRGRAARTAGPGRGEDVP